MRRLRMTYLMMLLCLLCACGGKETNELQAAMDFRKALLTRGGCSFRIRIDADMEQRVFSFTADCSAAPEGGLELTILSPESIAGICAKLGPDEGELSYEGASLSLGARSDGAPAPVRSPQLLLQAWREGYLAAAQQDGEELLAVFELGYEPETVSVRCWFDGEGRPCRAELYYRQQLFCRAEIESFILSSGGDYETSEENLG